MACTPSGDHLAPASHVIACALATLIHLGRSVLLVSGTNVAVDNAVERVVKTIRPDPGVVVRVGDPHIPAVARDPRMSLGALIRDRHKNFERQRTELQERLAELRADGPVAGLREAERIVRTFDEMGIAAARERVATTKAIEDLRTALGSIRQRLERERVDFAAEERSYRKASERYDETATARSAFDDVDALSAKLDGYAEVRDRARATVVRLQGDIGRLERELRSHNSTGLIARLRARSSARQRRDELERLRKDLAEAEARYRESEELFQRTDERQRPRIDALLRAAHPWTKAEIEERYTAMRERRRCSKLGRLVSMRHGLS